jgi:Domain of unknown function (DUF4397)
MSRSASSSLLAVIGTAALVASTIAGLKQGAAQGGTPTATPAGEPSCTADLGVVRSTKTCVNVAHASWDAPTVDVLFDGQEVINGLSYGSASGFAAIPTGTVEFQIVSSGEGSDLLEMTFSNLELVAGRAYEIAVVGSLAESTVVVNDVDVYAVEGSSQAG